MEKLFQSEAKYKSYFMAANKIKREQNKILISFKYKVFCN